jgi:hypothetical protein
MLLCQVFCLKNRLAEYGHSEICYVCASVRIWEEYLKISPFTAKMFQNVSTHEVERKFGAALTKNSGVEH